MPGGKGGAQRISPFDAGDRERTIDPLESAIGKGFEGFTVGGVQERLGTPHALQSAAANMFLNPGGGISSLQGAQGALGKAGGMFGQAQQAASSDPMGAQNAFRNMLSSNFTDVQNDPQTQALLGRQAEGMQSFLNKNLGQIGAAAQRAGGGVASGSGEVASKTRATTQAAEGLANQQAQTLFGEQARRQQMQLAAGQQALGHGLREAQVLGGLGQGLGGLGANLLGQQIGLGNQLYGQQAGAAMMPMDQMFRLGELLKSTSGVRQPGFLEQFGSMMGGIGSAAKGVTSIPGIG